MLQFLLTLTDEGNQSKVERIYHTYYDLMMKYALSKFNTFQSSNCQYDAEDAVQTTFIKIVRYINNINFSRSENDVKSYVFSILNNEICNILNESKNTFEDFENFEDFCIENEYNFLEEIEIQEKYIDVVKAIENLDEKYSTILYLVFCKGLSINQITEIMGISTKTVYTRLSRGKKLLIDSLKELKTNG